MKTLTMFLALVCAATAMLPAQIAAPLQQVAGYVLGQEDLLTVRVLDIEEFNAQNLGAIRVDPQGEIRLPLVGRMTVAGLHVEQVESKVRTGLLSVMNDPEVTVTVTEFGSRHVSVLGAIKNPGVHQISGRKTLFEVLSLAGGLGADAGNAIRVTRRVEAGPLPLAGVSLDATGRFFVASLNVRAVMEAKDPSVNIEVMPNDVISVPKAELVYVIGAVRKSGGFVLNEKEQMSALQALSLAEGLDNVAGAKAARILRQGAGQTARTEIPIDLRQVLEGGAPDIPLLANDILFVPTNKVKSITMRSLEVAIQMATGLVIFH